MTEWGIGSLFNPGQRHVEDEKRRLASTREDLGDSSGGRRIDLDLGKVVITKKTPGDQPDDESDAAAEGASDDAAADDELDDAVTDEASAAD